MAGVGDIFANAGFSSGGIGAGVSVFFKWLFWPILIFAVMYGVWWFMTYNVRVHVYNPKINGSIAELDKGKKTRDKKTKEIKGFALLKNKKNYSGAPITEDFFIPSKRGFGRIGYDLHMIVNNDGFLQPIKPPTGNDVYDWEGLKSSDVAWAMNTFEHAVNRYSQDKNFATLLAQLAPYIGLALIAVLMIVLMKQFEQIASALQAVATQIENVNIAQQVIK